MPQILIGQVMQWFLKVQLGFGGPGVEICLDVTITYSFYAFIGYFFLFSMLRYILLHHYFNQSVKLVLFPIKFLSFVKFLKVETSTK